MVLEKIWQGIRTAYTRAVVKELNQYGLRYQDLFLEDPAVLEALHRLPKQEALLRERRIKRAIEISLKRQPLPPEIQKAQQPTNGYLTPYLEEVEAEKVERDLLNSS